MSKSRTLQQELSSPLPQKSDSLGIRKKGISSETGKVTIVTYTSGQEKADFYIQSKGDHAGRPLRSPKPNSWAVYSKVPHLFEIAFSMYMSGHLRTLLLGSVIPFIRLSDYKPLLFKAAENAHQFNRENLRTLELIDAQINNFNQQINLLGQYQKALAYKINRKHNII